MADPELPRPRPHRVPSASSSHSDLLHTIAQLREQRIAAASATSSSPSSSAAASSSSSQKPPSYRSHLYSSSSHRSSNASGKRRLHKSGSTVAPPVSASNDLEDWHESEDSSTAHSTDSLADSLDKLSIANDHTNVTALANGPKFISSQKQKSKILDSFAVLDEVSKFGRRTPKASHEVTDLDDDDDDADTGKYSDKDDDFEAVSHSKHTTMKNCRGINLTAEEQSPEVSLDTDTNEKKNGGEDASVTFVHANMVFRLPPKVAKILFPHQLEGIKWLWGLHVKGTGGILGDDMGLGKTMQMASFLLGLFASDLIKRALIVAPKTLIAHWVKELTVVGLGKRTRDYSGTSASQRGYALQHVLQSGGILMTTYDVVRNNWQALRGDFHGRDGFGDTSEDITTWDYMVLDEGHLIKNPSTQRAKSLREVPCAHRIVLSGTPIQNNLREMWALFDFCCPNLLGDKKEFKGRYEDTILIANSKDSTDRQKRVGSAVAQELRKRIAPFFLRRMKCDVFPSSDNTEECKLSKKTDIIVWLRLSERQRELYTAFLESKTAHQSLEGSALAALTVLKKICDHPCLLTQRAADDIADGIETMLSAQDSAAAEAMSASVAKLLDNSEDIESHAILSCKIAFIMTLLDRLVDDGHRTLVFAQTRKMLDIIQKEVGRRQYDFRRIDGTMKASDREKCVQDFQSDSSIPIFLLTSKVGGLGLTLTAADRVIIVDPAWNPSTDNQSVDRAYRIGQKRDVVIYRLMTSGTIEEKIYRKQVFKGGLFKVATESKEQFRYFSNQELRELLTLPKSGFDISETQQQLHQEHSTQIVRDEELRDHIKFLETLNIAGVSHHDLLFSKQAPDVDTTANDHFLHWDAHTWRYTTSECRAAIASHPPHEWSKNTEEKAIITESKESLLEKQKTDVCQQITRLSRTLDDKSLVARLPDKGENIRKKLDDLTNQLENLKYISSAENSGDVAPSASQEFVPKDVKPRKDLKSVKQELQALKDLQMAKETCINPDANEVASIFAGLNL